MLIGYARVSADEQDLNLQHDALKNVGCERFFNDQITGSKIQWPGLDVTLEYVREGDRYNCCLALDQLSRSLKDLIEMVALLDFKKIGLKSHS